MIPFEYQIVVQWDSKRDKYVAYAPTLTMYAAKFLPTFAIESFSCSMSGAVQEATQASAAILEGLKNLAILPPPPDVGPANIGLKREDFSKVGEMVL